MGNFTSTSNDDRLAVLESRIQYLEQCLENQASVKDEAYEHVDKKRETKKTNPIPSWHKELMSEIQKRRSVLEPTF